MFLGVHHVAIIASNYERSKEFYTQILGFSIQSELYREDRKSYKLDLALPDGIQIELFSFPTPPCRLSYPEACGLRHLAFSVGNLDQAIAHLQQHNIDVEAKRIDELTGKSFAFFSDPDGLPLELYEI